MERLGSTEIKISILEFEKILPTICDAKISYVPKKWTPDNPLYGTCVPVSLVAQKIFGGKLLRADLKPYPKFRHMNWHWVNLLPDGRVKDFTKSQFAGNYPKDMKFVEKAPSTILRHDHVASRSNLLYKRLLKVI